MRQLALLMADVSYASWQKPRSYADIMNLDERIRRMSRMVPSDSKPAAIPPTSTCMLRLLQLAIRTYLPSVLLPIHRPFFDCALADHPKNPLLSEYAPSVHAVLRGARDSLQWLVFLMDENVSACSRLHHMWNTAFAAVVSFTHHHCQREEGEE
jgi:hypothetical protein